MNSPIGLIGIGLLGHAIAERLLANEFDVFGFDPRADLTSYVSMGGTVCDSLAAVASQTSRIVLCLPDSTVVKQVVSELEPHLDGHKLIDTTTGAPHDAVAISESLAKQGSTYIEANVAGSSEQMRQHAAKILVGSSEKDFCDEKHIFQTLGAKVFHVGDVGNASSMKLVVNLAIGLNRAVLAEAMAFGETLGFESQQIADILRNTPAYSAAMDTKAAKMVSGDFAPQARLRQHLKDVKLLIELGSKQDANLPLSTLHQDLLETLVEAGDGDLDNSAIIKAFRRSPSDD